MRNNNQVIQNPAENDFGNNSRKLIEAYSKFLLRNNRWSLRQPVLVNNHK